MTTEILKAGLLGIIIALLAITFYLGLIYWLGRLGIYLGLDKYLHTKIDTSDKGEVSHFGVAVFAIIFLICAIIGFGFNLGSNLF